MLLDFYALRIYTINKLRNAYIEGKNMNQEEEEEPHCELENDFLNDDLHLLLSVIHLIRLNRCSVYENMQG